MTDLALVLQQYGAALARVAALYAPPGAEREDLLQDVGLALISAVPRFRGNSSLKTYVLRIAHNCGARRLARRPPSTVALDEREHLAREPGPEQAVSSRMELERMEAALRCLPVACRAARARGPGSRWLQDLQTCLRSR